MTREQALREARKRWGKVAHIRAEEKLSSPEARAEARELFLGAKARIEAIDAEIKERLAALEWHQALIAERRRMVQQKTDNGYWSTFHKFAVGTMAGIGFWIKGQGDTWEEAFKSAGAQEARDAERYKKASA